MVAFIFILFIRKFNQRFQVMTVMSTMVERIQESLNAKKLIKESQELWIQKSFIEKKLEKLVENGIEIA